MKKYRISILIFQLGLLISGITAFFIPQGVSLVEHWAWRCSILFDLPLELVSWLDYVNTEVIRADGHAQFLWYGTDWLAFAHILFALLFIGPLLDPIKNRFIVHFGLVACALIVPTALIAGSLREIPFMWQCLDSSFGLFGAIPLLLALKYSGTQRLSKSNPK